MIFLQNSEDESRHIVGLILFLYHYTKNHIAKNNTQTSIQKIFTKVMGPAVDTQSRTDLSGKVHDTQWEKQNADARIRSQRDNKCPLLSTHILITCNMHRANIYVSSNDEYRKKCDAGLCDSD